MLRKERGFRLTVILGLGLALTASTYCSFQQDCVIKPGLGIGLLRLGDEYSRVMELFPRKKNIDQEFPQPFDCGTEYNWVDTKGGNGPSDGNMFIKLRKGLVFQIESSTTRYRTVDGLTKYSPPEEVERHYKNLRAYVLLNVTFRALGDRPLIYWISRHDGIAFAFAYNPNQGSRYLYEIIVFKPNTNICPDDGTVNSPDWQELVPYSLDLAKEGAELR